MRCEIYTCSARMYIKIFLPLQRLPRVPIYITPVRAYSARLHRSNVFSPFCARLYTLQNFCTSMYVQNLFALHMPKNFAPAVRTYTLKSFHLQFTLIYQKQLALWRVPKYYKILLLPVHCVPIYQNIFAVRTYMSYKHLRL